MAVMTVTRTPARRGLRGVWAWVYGSVLKLGPPTSSGMVAHATLARSRGIAPARPIIRQSPSPASAVRPGAPPSPAQADLSDEAALTPRGVRLRAEHQSANPASQVLPHVRHGIGEVPPLPHIVHELMKALSDPASTARSVARIAASDPTLAASLIRTVNSAALGLRRKITSVADAVSYLGYSTVRSLVVRMRLEQALPTRTEQAGYDAEDLWIHSLAVSNAADCLAQRLPEVDRGLVSTLGLLHDIGKLAINSYFPNAAAQLHLAPADRPDESFLDRERRVLGADHAEIGALLAAHWKLPSDLVEAIRWHHAPLQAPQSLSESVRKATTLVHIANQISKYCYVYSEDMEIDIVAQEEFDQVGLPGPLPRLLNGRMRGAISRAIFFAEDSRTRTLGSIRRFVRLCDPAQAARIVELPHTRGRGEAVVREEDDADRYFGPEALSVDVASRRPGRVEQAWKGGSRVRFGGKATAVAMDALVAAVTAHQESLPLSEEARLPARFLARRLLPNLTEVAGGGEMVDVAQWLEAGRFTMAIRSDDLAFARRFATPMRSSAGRRVVEQELANVLNLRWFSEIRASSDGSTLVFVSHPNRR